MSEMRFCKRCGYLGRHPIESEITGGQWATLIVLLLCFILPGVAYGIYLASGGGAKGFYVCPKCGARRMSVPPDSPVALAQRVDS
jgi:hypothetical protein